MYRARNYMSLVLILTFLVQDNVQVRRYVLIKIKEAPHAKGKFIEIPEEELKPNLDVKPNEKVNRTKVRSYRFFSGTLTKLKHLIHGGGKLLGKILHLKHKVIHGIKSLLHKKKHHHPGKIRLCVFCILIFNVITDYTNI